MNESTFEGAGGQDFYAFVAVEGRAARNSRV